MFANFLLVTIAHDFRVGAVVVEASDFRRRPLATRRRLYRFVDRSTDGATRPLQLDIAASVVLSAASRWADEVEGFLRRNKLDFISDHFKRKVESGGLKVISMSGSKLEVGQPWYSVPLASLVSAAYVCYARST